MIIFNRSNFEYIGNYISNFSILGSRNRISPDATSREKETYVSTSPRQKRLEPMTVDRYLKNRDKVKYITQGKKRRKEEIQKKEENISPKAKKLLGISDDDINLFIV